MTTTLVQCGAGAVRVTRFAGMLRLPGRRRGIWLNGRLLMAAGINYVLFHVHADRVDALPLKIAGTVVGAAVVIVANMDAVAHACPGVTM